MSKLLISEHPLQVLPRLAVAIGLNQAIVVQQIHYWLEKSRIEKNGHFWVYNTINQWKEQFPFWSKNTVQRILAKLKESGLLVGEFLSDNDSQLLYYRIDYAVMEKLESGELVLNEDLPTDTKLVSVEKKGKNQDRHQIGMGTDTKLGSVPTPNWCSPNSTETTSEISSETTGAGAPDLPAAAVGSPPAEPTKTAAVQAALEATPDAIAEEAPRVRSKSVDYLMAKGVEYQVAVDWMVARKTKQVTPTVWSLVVEEAEKAGITAVEAVKWAAARGYANFQADWYTPETPKAPVGATTGYTKFPAKPNLMDENRAAAAAYLAERKAKMGHVQAKDMGEVEKVVMQQADFLDDNWHPA
jgi:hypothetical protein